LQNGNNIHEGRKQVFETIKIYSDNIKLQWHETSYVVISMTEMSSVYRIEKIVRCMQLLTEH
jgi:hypothetical protein